MTPETIRFDFRALRCFNRPACPRCGDTLYASTSVAFSSGGYIEHTWVCERCAHEFNTAIEVPEAA